MPESDSPNTKYMLVYFERTDIKRGDRRRAKLERILDKKTCNTTEVVYATSLLRYQKDSHTTTVERRCLL